MRLQAAIATNARAALIDARLDFCHDVPGDKITTRYQRIWPNIVSAVPRCRRSIFYDNSHDAGPVEAAAFRAGLADYPPRCPDWTPGDLLTPFI